MVLGATATTLMELAGVTGSDYDQLQVAGILEVGGGLAVELLDGFVPAADADFQIFDGGTLSGTFSAVLLPDLPGMFGWDSSHLYSSGTLSVIPEPTTLPLLARIIHETSGCAALVHEPCSRVVRKAGKTWYHLSGQQ